MSDSDPKPSVQTTSIFQGGLIPPGDAAEQHGELAPEQIVAPEGLAEGTALLVVKRGPNVGSRYTLTADVLTAGRHPDSDVFLDDVSVSRRHAEFRRTDDGYDVVDVGSLNGTYVNREMIESSALSAGDEIQIGKFRLVYVIVSGDGKQSGDRSGRAGGDSAR